MAITINSRQTNVIGNKRREIIRFSTGAADTTALIRTGLNTVEWARLQGGTNGEDITANICRNASSGTTDNPTPRANGAVFITGITNVATYYLTAEGT